MQLQFASTEQFVKRSGRPANSVSKKTILIQEWLDAVRLSGKIAVVPEEFKSVKTVAAKNRKDGKFKFNRLTGGGVACTWQSAQVQEEVQEEVQEVQEVQEKASKKKR